jgi:hypothetical protein
VYGLKVDLESVGKKLLEECLFVAFENKNLKMTNILNGAKSIDMVASLYMHRSFFAKNKSRMDSNPVNILKQHASRIMLIFMKILKM